MAPGAPYDNWTDWLAANADADETVKVEALREYIAETGKAWAGRERITPDWVNKKLTKLGITDLIKHEASYMLRTAVTGTVDLAVYAYSRTEALEKAALRLNGTGSAHVSQLAGIGTPTFVAGPEDPNPAAADGDAPQTVDALLTAFRETVMLGTIAGPHYCAVGASRVLGEYGLPPIPERKTFTVTRPVEAVATTTVEAFDAESAMRVAGWRWEDGRNGYTLADAQATDAPSVAAAV